MAHVLSIPELPPERPRPPAPPAPPLLPEPLLGAHLEAPVVFVPSTWEYRHLRRTPDELPEAAELDSWGAEGWELIAVVPTSAAVHFYFKRQSR